MFSEPMVIETRKSLATKARPKSTHAQVRKKSSFLTREKKRKNMEFLEREMKKQRNKEKKKRKKQAKSD